MICKHKQNGICDKGLYKGRPSEGVCLNICKEREINGLPSLPRMAVNFTGAVIKQGIAKWPERSQEEIDRIKKICEHCDYYAIIEDQPRCTHEKCGCKLTIKICWATTNCPLLKWFFGVLYNKLEKVNRS